MIRRFTQRLSLLAAGVLCCAAVFVFAGSAQIFARTAASSSSNATSTLALPSSTGHVNDFAGVIDEATRKSLGAKLRALKERRDVELAVVTIETTGDADVFDYSLRLARAWGIGAKESDHAGLLLLVAVKDRKSFMQVSRHLEGELTDSVTGATLRSMRDSFRQGNYGAGISVGVDSIITRLDASARTAAPTTPPTFMDKILVWVIVIGALLIAFVALTLFAYVCYRVFIKPLFSPATTTRAPGVAEESSIFNNTVDSFASSMSSSSWSSSDSSSSSSSSDSSSSWGGFGGGSDYGGGGASDSW